MFKTNDEKILIQIFTIRDNIQDTKVKNFSIMGRFIDYSLDKVRP